MKIYVSGTLYKQKEAIEEFIEREFVTNCAFNGCEAEIIRDENDCTWIDGVDEIDGTFLLHALQDKFAL